MPPGNRCRASSRERRVRAVAARDVRDFEGRRGRRGASRAMMPASCSSNPTSPFPLDAHSSAFERSIRTRSARPGEDRTYGNGLSPRPIAPNTARATRRPATHRFTADLDAARDDAIREPELPIELQRAGLHRDARGRRAGSAALSMIRDPHAQSRQPERRAPGPLGPRRLDQHLRPLRGSHSPILCHIDGCFVKRTPIRFACPTAVAMDGRPL